MPQSTRSCPPSAWLVPLEGRAVLEWAAHFAARPWMRELPRGDGHAVVVLPGLLTGDWAMAPMRDILSKLGYQVHPWRQGLNVGPSRQLLTRLTRHIKKLYEQTGQPVSLVGWSMGGAMAHVMAARHPEMVRCVVTIGSPLNGLSHQSNLSTVFEWVSGLDQEDPKLKRWLKGVLKVPITSIVSRTDGLVSWESGVLEKHPRGETIQVLGASHLGMPANPAVLAVVADRLKQVPSRWKPYQNKSRWTSWMTETMHVSATPPRRSPRP